jgi:hypothetical protein
MMASKDDNKLKYSVDIAEEETEVASLKKQKTIGGDDNGDNGDDEDNDDGDSSLSIDDDYSSEPEEEVCSEEKMNIPTGSKEKLLI